MIRMSGILGFGELLPTEPGELPVPVLLRPYRYL